ncbi:hypothetical protein BJX63DRAFT_438595 [Aspergillus granulosus]|uniref:BZIP domain-containing protein n=1 Tax=Aspergillus granulosus TaxID=176169 RepID=A0ABR4GRG2_9EURO
MPLFPGSSVAEATDLALHLLYDLETPIAPLNTGITSGLLEIIPKATNDNTEDPESPAIIKSRPREKVPSPPLAMKGRVVVPGELCSEEESPRLQRRNLRRTQNREAQRRFRQRREELTNSLRKRAEQLEEKNQALEEAFSKKAAELDQLKRQNDELNLEVERLQQRWRLMAVLLKRPKSLQFLSMFLSETGLPVDDLADYVKCLGGLVFPDKT